MAERKWKRKNYFIKKGFQTRLITIILLLVTIVANLTGGIVYGILRINFLRENLQALFSLQSADDILLPAVLIAEFLSFVIVAIIGLFVSHRMAGPVYRFEKVTEEIGDGNFAFWVKLREKDEFKELADSFNVMMDNLTEHIFRVKEAFEDVKGDLEKSKQKLPEDLTAKLDKLESEIEFFQLREKKND
jgi:methyl-accepting chemotaxis protein